MTNTVSNPQSRMELLALAERVEKATGPVRELDATIADAVGLCVKNVANQTVYLHAGKPGSTTPLRYTASIDAAMTLAEGQEWCGGAIALLREAIDRLQLAGLGVKALPRFLTAACLRSIAAMEGE